MPETLSRVFVYDELNSRAILKQMLAVFGQDWHKTQCPSQAKPLNCYQHAQKCYLQAFNKTLMHPQPSEQMYPVASGKEAMPSKQKEMTMLTAIP